MDKWFHLTLYSHFTGHCINVHETFCYVQASLASKMVSVFITHVELLQVVMFPNGNQQYIQLDICCWPFHFTMYLLWSWWYIMSIDHVKCVPMEIKKTDVRAFKIPGIFHYLILVFPFLVFSVQHLLALQYLAHNLYWDAVTKKYCPPEKSDSDQCGPKCNAMSYQYLLISPYLQGLNKWKQPAHKIYIWPLLCFVCCKQQFCPYSSALIHFLSLPQWQ